MVIKKGNETRVEIFRKDRTLLSIPFTAAIIILLATIEKCIYYCNKPVLWLSVPYKE